MNIQQAKEQVKRTVQIYLMKDRYGSYRIPVEKQRPIFLIGAPGIGKTAIMEQIAQEMDLAIVSYSMTHHTRQSAIGLPFISHKTYQGHEFDVSEYTMSEIVASVYETIERSGKLEGILFLDEINCVSETLAPSMLQFLQYKMFGGHRIPQGWVVVTAGNPPQFNRSVRDFDIVTLDRMKVLDVEADYDAWRRYGVNRGIHGSILSYLDIKKKDFYVIENTVDGKTYVTARGWEDLSETIYLYEENHYPVDEVLIGQYLRNARIAREFASYYELYQKYKEDYQVQQILAGNPDKDVLKRAKKADFDERLSLMGLLLDAMQLEIRENMELESALRKLLPILKDVKAQLLCGSAESAGAASQGGSTVQAILAAKVDEISEQKHKLDQANALSDAARRDYNMILHTIRECAKDLKLKDITDPAQAFAYLKQTFDSEVAKMKAQSAKIKEELSNLFAFVKKQFGEGNEMLVLVTDLTVNDASARFIAQHGCEEYYQYNRKFQIYERQQEISSVLERFDDI